ncbi:ead/Ea22-like family protein [Pseudomonas sp. Eb3]|uniref:ead/Ea22-like family protein n=1 Tax=Pseudomonas sp. Eb3 TaxID=1327558 RepID=UPI0021070A75|nr:ead/Ea22-like family protein [Pseudomonas sp. Eb3]MCQ1989668.1 ead/Ea22-like family protein [Pseudomonas sp. Eb3]
MTIDKAKLKALAEAATPGRHYDRLESAGGGIKYECTGDDGSLVLKVDHKNNEFGFVGDRGEADEAFFLACGPATILALLAEIERLEKFEDWFVRLDQAEQSLSASFKAERDQLKAENEDYKSGQERYEQIIEDLKAEIEALRKALGEISGQVDGNIRCAVRDVVNCRGDVQDIYGYCDAIDGIIDAAMAKETSHG